MSNLIHFVILLRKRGKKKEGQAGAFVPCLSGGITLQTAPSPSLPRLEPQREAEWGGGGGRVSPGHKVQAREASRGWEANSSLAPLGAALVIFIHHSCFLLDIY